MAYQNVSSLIAYISRQYGIQFVLPSETAIAFITCIWVGGNLRRAQNSYQLSFRFRFSFSSAIRAN